MDWLQTNMAQSLVVLGLALLAIEILVLGFSTFVLFFVGGAALITGALMFIGVVDDTMLNAFLYVAIITCALAVFLWKPLKNMQTNVEDKKVTNDIIGHSFVTEHAISTTDNPTYRFSGVDWKLKSNQPIAAGTEVEVVQNEVGVFHVKAK